MRPVVGQGCDKNPPVRSDLPLHDLTGGNYWVPDAMQHLDASDLLRLGGGLSSDQINALNLGKVRALQNLQEAASLTVADNLLTVVNLTGHKLISGYPEGRRMWLNVKWYDAVDALIAEDGAYGPLAVEIDGAPASVETLLDLHDPYVPIYEAHGAMSQEWAGQLLGLGTDPNLPLSFDRVTGAVTKTLGELGAQDPGTHYETFHFVLNNKLVKDNRIPPYGMDYDEAEQRNILPVPASQYGNPGPGGSYDHWDEVALNPPPGADHASIELLYQPTSWEYIQFLDLANTGAVRIPRRRGAQPARCLAGDGDGGAPRDGARRSGSSGRRRAPTASTTTGTGRRTTPTIRVAHPPSTSRRTPPRLPATTGWTTTGTGWSTSPAIPGAATPAGRSRTRSARTV